LRYLRQPLRRCSVSGIWLGDTYFQKTAAAKNRGFQIAKGVIEWWRAVGRSRTDKGRTHRSPGPERLQISPLPHRAGTGLNACPSPLRRYVDPLVGPSDCIRARSLMQPGLVKAGYELALVPADSFGTVRFACHHARPPRHGTLFRRSDFENIEAMPLLTWSR
jgi:hypothetical protein